MWQAGWGKDRWGFRGEGEVRTWRTKAKKWRQVSPSGDKSTQHLTNEEPWSTHCRSCPWTLFDLSEIRMERNIINLHHGCACILDDAHELLREWFNFRKGRCGFEWSSLDNLLERVLSKTKYCAWSTRILLRCASNFFASAAEQEDDYKKLYEQLGKFFLLGIHEDPTKRATFADVPFAEVFWFNNGPDVCHTTSECIAVLPVHTSCKSGVRRARKLCAWSTPPMVLRCSCSRNSTYRSWRRRWAERVAGAASRVRNLVPTFIQEVLVQEVLADTVGKVTVIDWIVDSPGVLTTSEQGWTGNTERVMTAWVRKKGLAGNSDKAVKDLIWLLFDTSLLRSGYNVEWACAGRSAH